MRCKSLPGNESEQRGFSAHSLSGSSDTGSESEKWNLSSGYRQPRRAFNRMCTMLELDSPLPQKDRPSLGFLLSCQGLPATLSICSAGHTHRSRAVRHRTQMPSWGRHSFSSIRLFLGETCRQSKENSPGTAFGPALWFNVVLVYIWFLPWPWGPGHRSPRRCVSVCLPVCPSLLKNIWRFYFAGAEFLWTSRESLLFWWLLLFL